MKSDMTERQRKWFASLAASLPVKTGKSLEAWADIMRACPETAHRARLTWLKDHHGVSQNYGSMIINAAFPEEGGHWDDAETLRTNLWRDVAVLEAVERLADAIPDVVQTQRKTYTAFSRKVQFAAMRPLKSGGAVLGLKLSLEASGRLKAPARSESWSERLVSVVELPDAASVDDEVARLFALAAENG